MPRNEPKDPLQFGIEWVQDDVTLGQTFELTRQDANYQSLQLKDGRSFAGVDATRLYRDSRENTGLGVFGRRGTSIWNLFRPHWR